VVVLLAKEARLAIMAALHDVQGNAIKLNALAAGDADMLAQIN